VGDQQREERPTCETCGKPVEWVGTTCVNCWEVEHRLDQYLRSPKGVQVIRDKMPKLEDWVDGKPDAWDYDAVLRRYDATVERAVPVDHGYNLFWKKGTMAVQTGDETHARKAAALFIELWLRGVSASFADKIMDGFLFYLEKVEEFEKKNLTS
jgi:hypothetical protein